MGTVDKAVLLLESFSAEEPELGLSDLARKAKFDKATTRRLLVALADHGLVEQDAATRRYRLGAGLLRLARIREVHFPFLQVATPIIHDVAQQTGETVHLSAFSAGGLATLHVEESAKANRVSLAVGQVIPLHGTASGIAFLAFSRSDFVDSHLRRKLAAFTPHTITDRTRLLEIIKVTSLRGYSRGEQGFEEGVFGVAAPILDTDGYAVGTIGVASPLSRINTSIADRYGRITKKAAQDIAGRLFGEPAAGRVTSLKGHRT